MEHIFVSKRLPSLACWQEAFPQARIVGSIEDASKHMPAGILWLHLAHGQNPKILKTLQCPPGTRLVVMSDTPNDDQGLYALEAGALGYCNANAAVEVLLQVADVVSRDGLWVGASLLNRLLRQAVRNQSRPRQDWSTLLTPREAEIARAAARGLSNREIAEQLGITERTVKAHLTVVFEKLQLRDRLQLSLYIHGLTSDGD